MKILRFNAEELEEPLISVISQQIKQGSVLVYPTDTVYGIGCSIDCKDSVAKVFEIKHRSLDKPLSVAFPSLEMARGYADIGPNEEEYIKEHIDEPLTYVLKKRDTVPDIVTSGKDTVGVRIPDNIVLKKILSSAEVPIITTSVNLSGKPSPARVEDIDEGILEKVDLVLDTGPCKIGKPSEVIDLTTGKKLR